MYQLEAHNGETRVLLSSGRVMKLKELKELLPEYWAKDVE